MVVRSPVGEVPFQKRTYMTKLSGGRTFQKAGIARTKARWWEKKPRGWQEEVRHVLRQDCRQELNLRKQDRHFHFILKGYLLNYIMWDLRELGWINKDYYIERFNKYAVRMETSMRVRDEFKDRSFPVLFIVFRVTTERWPLFILNVHH